MQPSPVSVELMDYGALAPKFSSLKNRNDRLVSIPPKKNPNDLTSLPGFRCHKSKLQRLPPLARSSTQRIPTPNLIKQHWYGTVTTSLPLG